VAAARAAGLSLSFGFIAAEALSSAREAAALEPGDVIAFPRAAPASTPGRQGWLSIETWRLAARFDDLPSGRSLTILSEETTMPEQESTLSGGAQLDRPAGGPVRPGSPDLPGNQGRLDRLPVRISVSLGKVSLTAAELLRLAPGAVIELREPLGGEVEVLAGGSPFAKGELVTVDGALGVRITTLLP
jgi:type III secretion system YscQ/HrcQ family protein